MSNRRRRWAAAWARGRCPGRGGGSPWSGRGAAAWRTAPRSPWRRWTPRASSWSRSARPAPASGDWRRSSWPRCCWRWPRPPPCPGWRCPGPRPSRARPGGWRCSPGPPRCPQCPAPGGSAAAAAKPQNHTCSRHVDKVLSTLDRTYIRYVFNLEPKLDSWFTSLAFGIFGIWFFLLFSQQFCPEHTLFWYK